MAYKQIDERFWKDKKIKKLSKDGYLLFLYLLTSPHTHFTGLSEMTLDYVNIDTPLTESESKAAYKELVALGLIQYDADNELVWIVNMHKYHIKSPKHIKGATNHIANLPKSALCKNLSDVLNIPYRYPIDTHFSTEDTLCDGEIYPIDISRSKSRSKSKSKSKKEVEVMAHDEVDISENQKNEISTPEVEPPKISAADGKIGDMSDHAKWCDALAVLQLSQEDMSIITKLKEKHCKPIDAQTARLDMGKYWSKLKNDSVQQKILMFKDMRRDKEGITPDGKEKWKEQLKADGIYI